MHPMEGIVQEGLEVSSEVVAYLVLEEFLKQMELLFKEAPFLWMVVPFLLLGEHLSLGIPYSSLASLDLESPFAEFKFE